MAHSTAYPAAVSANSVTRRCTVTSRYRTRVASAACSLSPCVRTGTASSRFATSALPKLAIEATRKQMPTMW